MNHVTPPSPPASPAEGPADQKHPSDGCERPSEQFTPSELRAIAGVTGAAVVHAMLPRPSSTKGEEGKEGPDQGKDESEDEEAEPAAPSLKYGPVGEIVSKTVFAGETHTGEVLDRYVDLYQEVFRHDKGIVTYFDARGNKLAEEALPDNWYVDVLGTPRKRGQKPPVVRPQMTEAEKQEWHNRHRQKASTPDRVLPTDPDDLGYPFIATATVYGMDREENEGVDTPFELIDERLNDEVEDPSKRYFEGRKMTLRQAIIEIATAYDIPRAVAFGMGANESAFDREAISPAGAKGLFQLTPRGYKEAKQYAENHPELSGLVREGKLLGFEQRSHGTREWKNRLVSTEMFCAYYRYLQAELKPNFEQFEERLRALDPTFLVGTLDTIGTITAYNAGAPRIKKCIERFIKLSDEELKKKIGEPPYGVDVWMAVLAHSFGATLLGPDGKPLLDKKGKPKTTRVGLHVLAYAPKSLALGSLIMDEENHLSEWSREREGWERPEEESEPNVKASDKAQGGSRRKMLGALASLTGIGAVAGGMALGVQAIQEGREELASKEDSPKGVSRRTFVKGATAVAAVAIPFGKLISSPQEADHESGDKTPPSHPGENPRYYIHEKYEGNIMQQAKANLDAIYDDLAARERYGWTPTELDRIYKYKIPKQTKALRQDYEAAFGEDWVRRFLATKSKLTKKRKPLYEEGERRQKTYIQRAITAGELISMEEYNPENPYFCEQVGETSGTKNDKESLYMHKEFVPLLGSMIELVNHQIDRFNQNPAAYGVLDSDFPMIPHVNAVKISGALRSVMQTYAMLTGGQAGRTSKDLGPHWLGQAIDLGSFATQGSHMASFAEPFYSKRTTTLGSPELPANSKLPSQGFGTRTREILSKIFGRALLALEEPLKEKDITLMPLWEGRQLNWHVAIKPS